MKTPRNSDSAKTPIIVSKTYDFVKWLLPKVENFPRGYKFTVGDCLSNQGLDLLGTVVEAAFANSKEELLRAANGNVNRTRYLLRLAKDLNLMSVDSYGFSAEKLDEIGRMLGGWMKSLTPAR